MFDDMWIEVQGEELGFRNRSRIWKRYDLRRQYLNNPRNRDGLIDLLDKHLPSVTDETRRERYWIASPTIDLTAWQVLRMATGAYLDDMEEPPEDFGDDYDLRVVLPLEPVADDWDDWDDGDVEDDEGPWPEPEPLPDLRIEFPPVPGPKESGHEED